MSATYLHSPQRNTENVSAKERLTRKALQPRFRNDPKNKAGKKHIKKHILINVLTKDLLAKHSKKIDSVTKCLTYLAYSLDEDAQVAHVGSDLRVTTRKPYDESFEKIARVVIAALSDDVVDDSESVLSIADGSDSVKSDIESRDWEPPNPDDVADMLGQTL
ncbi:hypothetical protein CYMTET_12565 [Cymbomonas tetramitiformis]|uniref:Uncharacterized protein n=1 Tax=Cymbomonas tetramitiformis TaxID=36881 RepID=A0AAE0GK66_9CHLO|nr:hypothetical protein CYMTET_17487 [Cymbomonas tetramitiformis]KAK3279553.1 hypothetical protein CYMTET_12565 [Cymbomonas tetramitiformis]